MIRKDLVFKKVLDRMKNSIGILLLLIFSLVTCYGISQSSKSVKKMVLDTSLIETKCDCCNALILIQSEFLENIEINNEGKIAGDSISIEKRKTLYHQQIDISKKCELLVQENIKNETCTACDNFDELKQEFQLVKRVIEMNRRPSCN